MDGCKINRAVQGQAAEIAALYRSLAGTPGCTWNENYPTIEDVEDDIRRESLYIVCAGERIIAAAAAVEDDELERLACWNPQVGRPCGLERVGVIQEYQGQGIAGELVRQMEADMAAQGFDGIRLLAGKHNAKALALYEHLCYRRCGETRIYDMDWYCYEKDLTGETPC